MKHDYAAALAEFDACIHDDEDGSGYLFDMATGERGKAIRHALLMMQKLQEPSAKMMLKAHDEYSKHGLQCAIQTYYEQAEKEIVG